MPPVEVAHWPAKSFKVALGDHALTLRNDVEIGFVPPAVADRERGQVAGLVGPGLAICAAACSASFEDAKGRKAQRQRLHLPSMDFQTFEPNSWRLTAPRSAPYSTSVLPVHDSSILNLASLGVQVGQVA